MKPCSLLLLLSILAVLTAALPTRADEKVAPNIAPVDVWASPARMEAWLRANGAPFPVRFVIVQAMVIEKHKRAYEAARFSGNLKRWQRGSAPPTAEQREQMAAVNQQQQNELRQIFGNDYAEGIYGANSEASSGISPEKWMEINRIVSANRDARMRAGPNVAERRRIDQKINAELAVVLTTGELEQYQAYESEAAGQFKRRMAGLDVDDETYLRAFRAFRAFEETNADNAAASHTSTQRLAEYEAIREAVGPAVAMHIALTHNQSFREIRVIYSATGMPLEEIFERYKTWLQFNDELARFTVSSTRELDEAQQTIVRSYRDRLTAGLNQEQLRAFYRTGTGSFMIRKLPALAPKSEP